MTTRASWNTKRPYTNEGQVIGAEFIDSAPWPRVIFADVSRMIDGTFPVARQPRSEHELQAMTMAAYDNVNYEGVQYDDLAARDNVVRFANNHINRGE